MGITNHLQVLFDDPRKDLVPPKKTLKESYLRNHLSIDQWKSLVTPPKINIEPENDGLEDDFPLPGVYSQVPC